MGMNSARVLVVSKFNSCTLALMLMESTATSIPVDIATTATQVRCELTIAVYFHLLPNTQFSTKPGDPKFSCKSAVNLGGKGNGIIDPFVFESSTKCSCSIFVTERW